MPFTHTHTHTHTHIHKHIHTHTYLHVPHMQPNTNSGPGEARAYAALTLLQPLPPPLLPSAPASNFYRAATLCLLCANLPGTCDGWRTWRRLPDRLISGVFLHIVYQQNLWFVQNECTHSTPMVSGVFLHIVHQQNVWFVQNECTQSTPMVHLQYP